MDKFQETHSLPRLNLEERKSEELTNQKLPTKNIPGPEGCTGEFYQIFQRGSWVVQSVKHPTPGFGSGHNLRVVRLSPSSGSTLSLEPA